jgi:TrmH family RNA methyltransferase
MTMPKTDRRPQLVNSLNHYSVRRLQRLQQRAERDRTGLFLAEGIRFVAQAIEHDAAIEQLVTAPALLANPFGRKLARELRRAGTPGLEVTPEVFRGLAQAETPQGIAVVVRQRWEPLAPADPGAGLCWVALSAVQSPGNLGTILRTSDAVGGAGAILIGGAVDPYDPAVVRPTMGAIFAQRFTRASLPEFAAWKRCRGCFLVGTSPHGGVDYRSVAYRSPLVLFMGWERRGLSREDRALCDAVVRIPMVGSSDSLNLAVATGVMLYEVFNQRRAGGEWASGSCGRQPAPVVES